jgi:hypothetical protein
MSEQILTKELLNEKFKYKDGFLYWKENYWKNLIGSLAGTVSKNGYRRVNVNGKQYLEHRIIWLMHYGELPKIIDHIDNNPLNNKIENLRQANSQQNLYNSKISKRNKSGVKCVSWLKKLNKWQVSISVDGKKKYFGCYFDLEVAKFVAETMRYKYHKNFANS